MLLRYTGALPVTFMSIGLEVFPGDEFEVSAEAAAAFTARADVETVAAEPTPRGRRLMKDQSVPAVDPADSTGDSTTSAGQAPDPTASL